MRVWVIAFANEKPVFLKECFQKKLEFLKQNDDIGIFVNDKGYLDNTRNEIFKEVFEDSPNAILLQNENKESLKGGSIYLGLSYALTNFPDAELILYSDIDDSMDLQDGISKLNALDCSKTDIIDVFAGIRSKRALRDMVCSKAYSLFVKLLYPKLFKISDLHACFKAFRPYVLRDFFNSCKITDIGFSFEYDILLFSLQKYTIKQFKVGWEESKFTSGRTIKNIFKTILRVIKKRFFIKNSTVYKFYRG
ncbi:MAG: hypothetical protein FWD28_01635 [Treponema sp.]|nr:hypothetical protein [Treponema sp.]